MGCFCLENLQLNKHPEVPVSARPGQERKTPATTSGFLFFGGDMESASVVRQEAFEDLQLQIIEENGEEWFSAEGIGTALGLEGPRKAVIKIFNRHREEFDGLYRVPKLGTTLKSGHFLPRRLTVFNPQGAYLLAILARTPKSKALRRWLAKFMAHDLHTLKEHLAQCEAQHQADQEKIQHLIGKLGVTARELKKLQSAPKALAAPEAALLPEMKSPVLVDFHELQRLFYKGRAGFPDSYLHDVLNRNAAAPTFRLEINLPGAHRPEPFIILSGVAEVKLLP